MDFYLCWTFLTQTLEDPQRMPILVGRAYDLFKGNPLNNEIDPPASSILYFPSLVITDKNQFKASFSFSTSFERMEKSTIETNQSITHATA